jgi:hypothetical protein
LTAPVAGSSAAAKDSPFDRDDRLGNLDEASA